MLKAMAIAKSPVHVFDDSQIKMHPAAPIMLRYLESISKKNLKEFAAFFGSSDFPGFFANLPGSVKVRDPKKFIEMHEGFFESKTSGFVYGTLKDGIGNDDFLMCSVLADVTLPDGNKRWVHIDMTFVRNADNELQWIPIRFINTVVDKAQAVLHD